MILCVDIGNTNIKCAAGVSSLYEHAAMPTDALLVSESFANLLEQQFGSDIWEQLRGSIISSVVPQKTELIAEALRKKCAKAVHLRVGAIAFSKKCNIDISAYKSRLGEDRIVCCVAAVAKYKAPVVVIDFGTATTVNVINEDNIFIGGAIMTGVQTGLAALNRNTAQLPRVLDNRNNDSHACDDIAFDIISDDTEKSLISGAVMGAAYAAAGYVKHIKAALRSEPTVVITGGNASPIIKQCCFDFVYEPDLMVDGLFEMYKQGETR